MGGEREYGMVWYSIHTPTTTIRCANYNNFSFDFKKRDKG
jgi:hypothetical protein